MSKRNGRNLLDYSETIVLKGLLVVPCDRASGHVTWQACIKYEIRQRAGFCPGLNVVYVTDV